MREKGSPNMATLKGSKKEITILIGELYMEAQDFNTTSVQAFIAEQVEKTKAHFEQNGARREKIENLKAMIRANIYDVSSEKIAERLVEVLSRNVRIKVL